ncbi:MAG: hypothetical protein E6K74_00255 [Candidatus Eisenbacteria bacterium]|uniref:Uncharacterized protein n=1 Tax=Eiseniibacteriota bacterium TaxID=2212470 RepID=A0A538SY42_UNCEI|nr:MAG: hypothetical protein E6K74_00255 [Candidatus Eisenbacteria bacterium]
MLRRLALLLGAAVLLSIGPFPARVHADMTTFVGPTQILFVDADSVLFVVTKEWMSASVRHQEKLLRHSIRMTYWLEHIPADMRMVFDALGYPTSRVLLTPVGHTEEWWYYGQLNPPFRFRDGELIDTDRFEALTRR